MEQRASAFSGSTTYQAGRDVHVNAPPSAIPGLATLVVPEEVTHTVRGRDGLLTDLAATVESGGHVVVLHGNGGNGKTTVAVQVARRASVEVWWVNAGSAANVAEGLREVALRAGADEAAVRHAWTGAGSAPEVLWRALDARAEPWLLVLDNADDPRVLAPNGERVASGRGWLRTPRSTGTVLITSRDGRRSEWGDRTFVPLAVLDGADAARVLLDLAPEAGAEPDARALAERLGGLPLGLRLAGHYLRSTTEAVRLPGAVQPRTFAEYRQALAEGADLGGRETLTGTWELSLDLLANRGHHLARPLLRLLSTFAPAPIPVALLDATVLADEDVFAGVTVQRLTDAVEGLRGLGLVDHRADALALHPLVHDAGDPHASDFADLRQRMITAATVGSKTHDPSTWPLWHAVLPHCARVADSAMDLLIDAAVFCLQVGLAADSERLFRRVLREMTTTFGEHHRETLLMRYTLANMVAWRGEDEVAAAEYRAVLDAQQRTLGPDHGDTVDTRIALARITGAHDPAATEARLRALLAVQAETLGAQDEVTLDTRAELAREVVAQDRFAEALVIYRELFEARCAVQGEEHPETMDVRQHLASVLCLAGDVDGADAEFRALLPQQSRVLGPEHSSTLLTRASAAMNLARRGHLDRAESELRETIALCERVLGPDHVQTSLARDSLDRVREAR
ncbi:tetratricopeptide repeat protein [Saccharothrix hoggarensis]|uniref:Tetratricopeptide repeat protein n=1 Tax=Saccharothrix hoggarensis TaxID=913853 RepID=A0ABW3QTY3_9PSEU